MKSGQPAPDHPPLPTHRSTPRPSRTSATGSPTAPFAGQTDQAHKVNPDDFTLSSLQSLPDAQQEGIFVPHWATVVTGSRSKAELLVLSQLAYWFGISKKTGQVRAKLRREGYLWVYKSHAALGRETKLTQGAVRGALRSLEKRGLIICQPQVGSVTRFRLVASRILRVVEKPWLAGSQVEEEDDEL